MIDEKEVTRIAKENLESPFPLTSGYYTAYEMMLEKEKERVRAGLRRNERSWEGWM